MAAPSQMRQINSCCYPGEVPDSCLAWGLLPARGRWLLISAWEQSWVVKCNWSSLLKEACYLGSPQRRTPRCHLYFQQSVTKQSRYQGAVLDGSQRRDFPPWRGKPAWANTWQALQVVPRSRKFTQVLPWCEAEPTAQSPEGLSPPSMSCCRQPWWHRVSCCCTQQGTMFFRKPLAGVHQSFPTYLLPHGKWRGLGWELG